MLHLRHEYTKERKDEKPTSAQLIGSATHCLVFEPHKFNARYAVYSGTRNPRYKDYQEFLNRHEGKDILNPTEHELAYDAAKMVQNYPLAQEYLDEAEPEVTLVAELCGIQCKGRVDGLGKTLLLDLKGTANIEKHAFGKVAARLHYRKKLAFYRELCRANGRDIQEVILIVHEQKPPYDPAVVPIYEPELDEAWPAVERTLLRLKESIETNKWPGIAGDELYEFVTPNWDMEDEALVEFKG